MFRLSGWFRSSQGHVETNDSQAHLDWLFHQLEGKEESLAKLRHDGTEMDVACFWVSAHGHGGPTLSPERAGKLASLGLPLWYDIYFGDDGV